MSECTTLDYANVMVNSVGTTENTNLPDSDSTAEDRQ